MFYEKGYWAKTLYLLERGLDVAVLRRRVIADNIANATTPHFKKSRVSFEAQLKRALDSEKWVKENAIPTKVTHERHIPFFRPLDYKKVSPRVHIDYLTTMRNDGNNVDLEEEMTIALKNQLRAQLMSELTSRMFQNVRMVMDFRV